MICTYCGSERHTAPRCPWRPLLVALQAVALALAACSGPPPVPPSKLTPPAAELMVDPGTLEPIPACEGEKTCRAGYYARSRADRADLASRLRGLQRYVRVVAGK